MSSHRLDPTSPFAIIDAHLADAGRAISADRQGALGGAADLAAAQVLEALGLLRDAIAWKASQETN